MQCRCQTYQGIVLDTARKTGWQFLQACVIGETTFLVINWGNAIDSIPPISLHSPKVNNNKKRELQFNPTHPMTGITEVTTTKDKKRVNKFELLLSCGIFKENCLESHIEIAKPCIRNLSKACYTSLLCIFIFAAVSFPNNLILELQGCASWQQMLGYKNPVIRQPCSHLSEAQC